MIYHKLFNALIIVLIGILFVQCSSEKTYYKYVIENSSEEIYLGTNKGIGFEINGSDTIIGPVSPIIFFNDKFSELKNFKSFQVEIEGLKPNSGEFSVCVNEKDYGSYTCSNNLDWQLAIQELQKSSISDSANVKVEIKWVYHTAMELPPEIKLGYNIKTIDSTKTGVIQFKLKKVNRSDWPVIRWH